MLAAGMYHHRLSQDQRPLLHSNSGTLKHDPIFIDFSIVWESSHGRDALFGQIGRGTTGSGITLGSNAVYLLVEFGTVEVSILTCTGYSSGNTGWMPGSDTGNLTKTTVGLTRKTSDSPTSGNTFISLTLGDSNDVYLLI